MRYPPAKTLEEPVATNVQPATLSPILPHPLPLTLTVKDPKVIGAACAGQAGTKGGN